MQPYYHVINQNLTIMDIKKLIIATLAGFFTLFILGYVWHILLMSDFYANHQGRIGNVDREEPLILYIALGTFVLAFLMSYMYPKGMEGSNHIMDGLKFGAIIGLLWVLPHNIVLYGATTVLSKTAILGDGLWHIVEEGLGGLVIALVYGKQKVENITAN